MGAGDLVQLATANCLALHFPVVLSLLVWLLVRHRTAYRQVRHLLVLTTAACLVIHLALPLAPPRMLRGFVATATADGMSAYDA